MPYPDLTPAEHANFLGAKVVAGATGYLDGRHDAAQLARDVDRLHLEMMTAAYDLQANRILDPARLLLIAMSRAALAEGDARLDRWQQVMGSLVELVRIESGDLKREAMRQ